MVIFRKIETIDPAPEGGHWVIVLHLFSETQQLLIGTVQ